MSFFSWIASIFSPAVKLVDELHTSEEEKGQLRNELASIQELANSKLLELEKARLEALQKVQVAESKSQFWFVAAWRPLTSIALVIFIILGGFGVVSVPGEIYSLAEIFLGAYGTGRSLEKIASVVKLGK